MERSTLGLRPGSVIQDTYRVTDLLGEGGMGATFAGENLATGHAVAIKVITPEFARNAKSAQLFRREATLLRNVQNDAVVRYETTMIDKSGQLYLVMEYIRGRPLAHYLDRGARLASDDVLKLAKRLLGGLDAIHRLGIVHRDISPDNIMIPDDDILGAKLIDFGVASDTVDSEKSIIGDTFAGKISYASPEQLGIGSAKVAAASDLYSTGLVLMRVAGLKVPGAGGKLVDAIDARRADVTVSGENVSSSLAEVLNALLRADPKARPTEPLGFVNKVLTSTTAKKVEAYNEPLNKNGVKNSSKPAPFKDDVRTEGSSTNIGTSRSGIFVLASVVVLAVVSGAGFWIYKSNSQNVAEGTAIEQAAIARNATQSDDPLKEVTSLVRTGGEENLNSAFGALVSIARDETADTQLRGRASLMIARMYDPETYDPTTSPFPAANLNAAIRFYTEAKNHGAEGAEDALARLQQ